MSTIISDCHRRSDFLMVSTFGAGFAMYRSSLGCDPFYSSPIFPLASSYDKFFEAVRPLAVEVCCSCSIYPIQSRGILGLGLWSRLYQNFRKPLRVDGLYQMMIVSRVARLFTIFLSAPSRLSDECDVLKLRLLAQPTRQVITVHSRQAEIDQSKIRHEVGHKLHRARSVIGNAHVMAHGLKQQLQALRLILIIVDDHNPHSRSRRGRRPLCRVSGVRYLR